MDKTLRKHVFHEAEVADIAFRAALREGHGGINMLGGTDFDRRVVNGIVCSGQAVTAFPNKSSSCNGNGDTVSSSN
jgi:hypothetical protein